MKKFVWEIIHTGDDYIIKRPEKDDAHAATLAAAQKKMLRSYRSKCSSWARHQWTVGVADVADDRIEAYAHPPATAPTEKVLLVLNADLYESAKRAAFGNGETLTDFIRHAISLKIDWIIL